MACKHGDKSAQQAEIFTVTLNVKHERRTRGGILFTIGKSLMAMFSKV